MDTHRTEIKTALLSKNFNVFFFIIKPSIISYTLLSEPPMPLLQPDCLYTEASSPDELSKQRIHRYILTTDPHKIVQEFEESFGLQIFRAVPVYRK